MRDLRVVGGGSCPRVHGSTSLTTLTEVVTDDQQQRLQPHPLRRAADAHHEQQRQSGRPDRDWPDWYARYIGQEQAGHGDQRTVPGAGDGATVPVAVVSSRTEAELIVGMLRSNDLTAAVSADDAGGQEPALQAQGVRVLVAPSDEATARQLLAAADDTPA
jgi:hypothetical protein